MPRIVDHGRRRRDLALAACAVIARAGLAGATLRDVAAEAGCTTGMVSHYFDGKDALLVAALDAAAAQTAERIGRHTGGTDADVRAVLAECLPLDDTRRAEWRVWVAFWGAAAADPLLRAQHARRYARWRAAVAAALARAGRPAARCAADADELTVLVDGVGLHATFEPRAWPAHRQLARLDAALAALRAAPGG